MGFHDNVKALEKDVRIGNVTATLENDNIILEGNTYRHKEFLKSELDGTDIHWDKERKVWIIPVSSVKYDGDKSRIAGWFGIEL